MFWIEVLFVLGIVVTFYSYIGYGILVWLILKIRNTGKRPAGNEDDRPFTPPVTLIIAAYNEEDFILQKIENSLSLDYPKDALKIIFITDGSTDATPAIVRQFPQIQALHSDARQGKVAAMHRAMDYVQTPYVIFSDANTLLNTESIRNIVRHYQNPAVGGVAGEKKVLHSGSNDAAGAGEGLYWKYESFLKKLDWNFYTVVGAAGELFSIRRELYEYPGKNILLDDFIISLRVCQKGYRVAYEADAYAMETASSSIKEERKRKIRISAGGFQSMYLLKDLLNIFKYPTLSFQYISHRVLRWTLCPLFLPPILICNILLVVAGTSPVYSLILAGQVLFYGMAAAGWLLSMKNIKVPFLYAPYYFVFINVSLYLGFVRFLKGRQTVLWEKAARAKYTVPETAPER
jgi:cellulose synthase/poly-beta-1,6-N-acetylglucosamine synthase-like glycosyltransferase